MATFTLAVHKVEQATSFAVITSRFEAGNEQRRLDHPKRIATWRITAPLMVESQIQAYQDFYAARNGEFESFQWTPTGESVEVTVRFDSPIKKSINDAVYTLTFSFIEVEA